MLRRFVLFYCPWTFKKHAIRNICKVLDPEALHRFQETQGKGNVTNAPCLPAVLSVLAAAFSCSLLVFYSFLNRNQAVPSFSLPYNSPSLFPIVTAVVIIYRDGELCLGLDGH